MTVEKVWDELWVGVKGLSSWVIAGSLRNAFRGSVGQYFIRVQWGLSFIVERETALDRRIRPQNCVQSLRP